MAKRKKQDIMRLLPEHFDALYVAIEEFVAVEDDLDDKRPTSGRKLQLWELADSIMEQAGKPDKSIYRTNMSRIMRKMDRRLGYIMPTLAMGHKGSSAETVSNYAERISMSMTDVREIVAYNPSLVEYLKEGDYPHLKMYLKDVIAEKRA